MANTSHMSIYKIEFIIFILATLVCMNHMISDGSCMSGCTIWSKELFFLCRYRDRNSGKFPTPSYVRKEVGGSYYTVRKFVQELEYKSKLSSSKTGNETSSGKELAKENEASTKLKDNSSSQITLDVEINKDGPTVAINGMDTSDSSCMHFEVKEGSQVSLSVDNTLSEQVTTPTATTVRSEMLSSFLLVLYLVIIYVSKEQLHPSWTRGLETIGKFLVLG